MQNFKVAYIASPIHSGSTLLDYVLGSHTKMVSVGEISKLREFVLMRHQAKDPSLSNRCACGAESILLCDFWRAVDEEICRLGGGRWRLCDLNPSSPEMEQFGRDNKLIFQAIANISGASVIVDSSKSPERGRRLFETPGFDTAIIQLDRSVYGQVYSVYKRSPALGIWHATMPYRRFQTQAKRNLGALRTVTVSYDDLTTNTKHEISRITELLGLQFEDGQVNFRTAEHHNIAGNRMRFEKSSEIVSDQKWRSGLSINQKLKIAIYTSPWISDRIDMSGTRRRQGG